MKKITYLFGKLKIFFIKTDISRIGKLIYQYEIFKLIKNLPGDILNLVFSKVTV